MLLLLLLSLFKLQVQNETRSNDRSFALKVKNCFKALSQKCFSWWGNTKRERVFLFFDFKFII